MNSNHICQVKIYLIKKNSENNDFTYFYLVITLNKEKLIYIIILYLYKLNF